VRLASPTLPSTSRVTLGVKRSSTTRLDKEDTRGARDPSALAPPPRRFAPIASSWLEHDLPSVDQQYPPAAGLWSERRCSKRRTVNQRLAELERHGAWNRDDTCFGDWDRCGRFRRAVRSVCAAGASGKGLPETPRHARCQHPWCAVILGSVPSLHGEPKRDCLRQLEAGENPTAARASMLRATTHAGTGWGDPQRVSS
jgi:hypothetical protein